MLTLPIDIPILFTQGSADPICPAEILKKRLNRLPPGKIVYYEIEQALHEPFIGDQAEELAHFLKSELKKLSSQTTSSAFR